MTTPDVFRTLDCWLWRIDPSTGRVATLGGRSPFGPDAIGWHAILRRCGIDARHAVLEAVRLLRASDEDGSLRVDGIGIPAAAGHNLHVDLVIGRQRDSGGAEAWAGIVFRRWPSASGPAPAAGEPAEHSVAVELDAAGLGWWSLENIEQGLSLSRTASRLMGFGNAACSVPLGAWLAHAPPQDYPRLMKQMERILDGDIDRFELDLQGTDPARPHMRLRLTAFRARTPGNEVVGVVEAVEGPAPAPAMRPLPTSHAPQQPETGLDRDSLVREIHHRIKNHLQGMTGLIERYRNDYPGLGEALDAIGGQLHSIGTVYGLLARSGRSDLSLGEIAQAVTDGLSGISPSGISTHFPEDLARCRISEQHCVSIALVVNELLMNAIKHGSSQPGTAPVHVACEALAEGCLLSIRNAGALPAGFDFAAGSGTRTGLQLVRAMLPARGAGLEIRSSDSQVEVLLRLAPPVLSAPPQRTDASSFHP
ncbi:MAG: sensor histidine kinase [Betaproteobacteria bacterium]|jgi:two-component sensor histidine kinase|nr:sensor histidine kinase [Betaproteobacteria bacterium]